MQIFFGENGFFNKKTSFIMEKNVFFYEEKASFGGENADGDEKM